MKLTGGCDSRDNEDNVVYSISSSISTSADHAKYMTFFVSAWTVIARAIAPGVRSSLQPDWWDPSPLRKRKREQVAVKFATFIPSKTTDRISFRPTCRVLSLQDGTELGTPQDGRNRLALESRQTAYTVHRYDTIGKSNTVVRQSRNDYRPIAHDND